MAQYASYSGFIGGSGGGGGGSVNSVTASAPLASSGGANPNITITTSGASTNGQLTSTDWNTFNNKQDALTGTANSFAGFDAGGLPESIPGYLFDATTKGMNVTFDVQPNDLNGNTLNLWNVNFAPLQNSPDENWNIFSLQANLDTNNSGFTEGTSGQFAQLLNLGFFHNNTGNVGGLNTININSSIGNGTDPIEIGLFSYINGFGNINANVTLNSGLTGYGFQPNVSSSAVSTPGFYVNAFYDAANIGVAVHGYQGLVLAPTIAEIANNSGYSGINMNPTITTLTGNANMNGVSVTGNITTMGASSGFNGVTINPNITTSHGFISGVNINHQISGGDANYTALNINPGGGATLSDPKAININMSGINTTNPQGKVGIESDSRLSINATTQLAAAQTFQIGSRIENLFQVPPGSPVTGTDSLGINVAGDLYAQDDIALGGIGLGFASVGFIASLAVAPTKTVDAITTFLSASALPDPGGPTGGNITDMYMIRTLAPLNQGGTANITNLYGLKVDNFGGAFHLAATNTWGVYVEDTTSKNFFGGPVEAKTITVNGAVQPNITSLAGVPLVIATQDSTVANTDIVFIQSGGTTFVGGTSGTVSLLSGDAEGVTGNVEISVGSSTSAASGDIRIFNNAGTSGGNLNIDLSAVTGAEMIVNATNVQIQTTLNMNANNIENAADVQTQVLSIVAGADKIGTATLVAGTVTVSNTSTGTGSRIFVTSQADGGTPGFLRVTNIVAGVSFDIVSSSNTDTSTVAWFIVEQL